MIYHAVIQNTPEWKAMRLGIPCSSEFHRIITPKKMELSAQRYKLMFRLLAEWMTGTSVAEADELRSEYMDRGHELEDRAIAAYEMLTEQETQPGGFITTDDGMVGCSPDRLVGTAGDAELKCPALNTQIKNALLGTLDDDYRCQLQGRLLIHGREWVDIMPYHPAITIPPVRVVRDDKFITPLERALKEFVAEMLDKRCELERRFGPFVRQSDDVAPDHSDDFLTEADAEMIIAARFGETISR